MAVGVRLSAWTAFAALLGAASVAAWFVPSQLIDWQPALAAREPWRAWSAAFVHWSALHLGANLLGTAAVALFGAAARVPAAAALAWIMAWPLTQAGLWMQPGLAHYGGLSGVLHAGAAVAALWLVLDARDGRRWIGAAVLAGLLAKIALEAPWGPALRHAAGWDIAIAPLAHATGAAAGAGCALCVRAVRRWRSPRLGSPA